MKRLWGLAWILLACALRGAASTAAVHVLGSDSRGPRSYAAEQICVFDAVEVEIQCIESESTAQLQVWRTLGDTVSDAEGRQILYSNQSVRCAHSLEQGPMIECLLHKPRCRPVVEDVRIDSTTNVLSVSFDVPTTTPRLMRRALVLAALTIAPHPQGPMVGDWIDDQKLDISLEPTDAALLVAAEQRGNLCVETRKWERNDDGGMEATASTEQRPLRLRFREHGDYTVAVVVGDHVVDSFNASVQFCDETAVVRPSRVNSTKQHAGQPNPAVGQLASVTTPEISTAGVLAVAPKQGLAFHPPSFFGNSDGWSLAFWLYLDEPTAAPAGFRTLFYKGVGGQRTPSAWLLPGSRYVALRASTVREEDVGATSSVQLPVREWVHLAFVFDNSTEEFTYKFFVNGKLDVALHYQHTVLANDSSLHILKDPTHSGPPALITSLQIWETPLATATVEAEYAKNHITSISSWMDPALSVSAQLVQEAAVTVR